MNIFEQQANRSAIEDSTVYIDRTGNGRKFLVMFSGSCAELVKARAEREYKSLSTFASPSISSIREEDGNFSQCVTYYSMD